MDEKKLDRLLDHIDRTAQRDDKVVTALSELKNDTTILSGKIDSMQVSMDSVKKDVQEHEEFIKGPPYPGAAKDIDRLNQSSKFQKKGLWIVAATAVGSLTKAIWSFVTGSP